MKKIIIKLFAVIISLIMIISTVCYGASSSSLKNQQNELDNKIDETKEKLEDVKEEKSETLEEVEKLTDKISNYQSEIDELEEKVSELNVSIKESEEKLNKAQEDYTAQEESLKQRLVSMYEAGDTTYLDVLLSSDDFTDLISNWYLVAEIATYDADLLEKIEKQKNEIENAKAELENNKKDLQTTKSSKQAKTVELASAKEEKNKKVAELSESEKSLQKDLEQFQKDKAEIQNELKKIAQSNKNNIKPENNIANNPSKSGYISPIEGLTKSNISCGFYGYAGHTGVDFSGGLYGKTVRAVKSGVVVKSKTTTGNIPNYGSNGTYVGSYSSYGEYIVIDHEDGTMTLYAHGKPGSRQVSVGQRVTQGQAIMQVGNTGNVQPRPSASNPTAGTHLHFEVLVNGVPVNPMNYL